VASGLARIVVVDNSSSAEVKAVVEAARCMDELNVGVIPVCEGDKLVGMVTDRDIVVRGVAVEADPKTLKLADVMSTHVRCAREDEDIDQVLGQMAEAQIRRLPVLNRDKRLVGIVSLGDLAVQTKNTQLSGEVLEYVSEPATPQR